VPGGDENVTERISTNVAGRSIADAIVGRECEPRFWRLAVLVVAETQKSGAVTFNFHDEDGVSIVTGEKIGQWRP
jgi:hypothetical protein